MFDDRIEMQVQGVLDKNNYSRVEEDVCDEHRGAVGWRPRPLYHIPNGSLGGRYRSDSRRVRCRWLGGGDIRGWEGHSDARGNPYAVFGGVHNGCIRVGLRGALLECGRIEYCEYWVEFMAGDSVGAAGICSGYCFML